VGTDKRQRQKEQRQTRLEVAQKQAGRTATRRRIINIVGLVVVVGAVVALIAFLTDDGDDVATDETASSVDAPSTTAAPAGAIQGPGPGAAITGETPCPNPDGSSERTTSFEQAPPTCIDPAKTYLATFDTSAGTFTAEMATAQAPNAVNNFVTLSRYHFYDGIPFHRIIQDFVVQVGDPDDNPVGGGGPGYSFGDELPAPEDYTAYSLAMANSGPDTNGSQFFIVLSENGATSLSAAVGGEAAYSLFGKVIEGTEVVDVIGLTPVEGDRPTEQVTVNSITIVEQ
jgi:cyclophilin family peptidyl-prolyl cis-trans isomerase